MAGTSSPYAQAAKSVLPAHHGPHHVRRCRPSQDFDTGVACDMRGVADPAAAVNLRCPKTQTCELFASNPEEGVTSFDSVAEAFVGLLRALTFDDWTNPMCAS